MNYFSVCDGIGAAHMALLPLGCECVGVSEIDKFCNQLIKSKYGFKNYGDFTKWREWGKIKVDVVIGGCPCTAFSNLGQRRGTADPAGQLSLDFVRFVCRNSPSWFIFENVPQVLLADRKRLWRFMLTTFSNRGYSLSWQVLDSRYFGVPQRRRRVFLVGNLGDSTGAGKVLFDSKTLPVFVKPSTEKGQEHSRTLAFNHYTDSGIQDRMCKQSEYHYERYRQNDSTLGTLATQIDAGAEQITRLVIDGDRVRYLTPLECEGLQGFPNDYTKGFSDTQRYKMLGNSMAVPVISWIGERILSVEQ
jgi:DNA (cytosine-5)-methyltransferase 1